MKRILKSSIFVLLLVGLVAGVKKLWFSSSQKKFEPVSIVRETAPLPMTPVSQEDVPEADRISQLFTKGEGRLPIVETIRYVSDVSWLKGRPAWITDYARHYSTSRHFIARSLNGKVDYFTQTVRSGDCFNVFRRDKNFQFYLLVDITRCKMAFYYIDLDSNERVLLKTYRVGLGKPANTVSGVLTPIGRYAMGDKVAVYKPGVMGTFQNQSVEMVGVFGTRWIPFGKGQGTDSKNFGLHGAPWYWDEERGQWIEDLETIGCHSSDGCIRMRHQDMEEIFAIVITKPTIIEIVQQFEDALLPGIERR